MPQIHRYLPLDLLYEDNVTVVHSPKKRTFTELLLSSTHIAFDGQKEYPSIFAHSNKCGDLHAIMNASELPYSYVFEKHSSHTRMLEITSPTNFSDVVAPLCSADFFGKLRRQ